MFIAIIVAKVLILTFLAVGVATILATYYRRRRNGVRPWRAANSRILGYDPPAVEIVQPDFPSHTTGEPNG
ncbi:hypothetical protein [Mycobacterium paraterrae]|uniref:Secreted protein n=1 Tax=Mycobacterium paraterrae TaxID=577492 RepID=A0ABY3VNE4_9MYCO|nr:hypothetical protein [Mycobacterium paraterrae]UMB70978.2 hypothetical protein MKK62_06770 [Mycobacterium paraterrae]